MFVLLNDFYCILLSSPCLLTLSTVSRVHKKVFYHYKRLLPKMQFLKSTALIELIQIIEFKLLSSIKNFYIIKFFDTK